MIGRRARADHRWRRLLYLGAAVLALAGLARPAQVALTESGGVPGSCRTETADWPWSTPGTDTADEPRLPPGHPPVLRLPPGHPPVRGMPLPGGAPFFPQDTVRDL